MRITNATASKLNQSIEPKTTLAAFLSEGMKEISLNIKWIE